MSGHFAVYTAISRLDTIEINGHGGSLSHNITLAFMLYVWMYLSEMTPFLCLQSKPWPLPMTLTAFNVSIFVCASKIGLELADAFVSAQRARHVDADYLTVDN
jgi:hypothetical protein